MTDSDDDRAREWAVHLNIVSEAFRRTQYEPVDDALLERAVFYLLANQRNIVVPKAGL